MTGMLTVVRSRVPQSCIAESIRGRGCSVSLAGAPADRLIIDFDKRGLSLLPNATTRCDYLLLAEAYGTASLVAPVELKSGDFDFAAVQRQLQAGAGVAEQLIPDEFKAQVQFLPVLASRNVPKGARTRTRYDVRFGNKLEPIRRVRCGHPLPLT